MLFQALEHFSPTTSVLLYTAAAVCVIALVSYLRFLFKTPGPWGIPLLGYYPFLKEDFVTQLQELTKKHGDVYIINIAGQNFAYLGNINALREVHVTKAQYFPSRSTKYSALQHCFGSGILYMKGEAWRVQRKVFGQSLREAGLSPNKEELKGPIGDAVRSTIDTLREKPGESIDVFSLLSEKCTATILRLFLGDAVSEDEAAKLNVSYLKMSAPFFGKNILLLGPIARYLILPWARGFSEMKEGKKETETLLHKIVSDHKANFDPDQQPRDFIDVYLRERADREKKGEPQAKHFTDSALVANLMQAYGDGSVSVGLFIAAVLCDLSLHRDVQDAIFEEINRVIGPERLPNWEDRSQLPLTLSAIKELQRITKIFSVFPSMECVEDTTIVGIHVPKGCITLVNAWAIHHDPNLYKDPNKFDITRFLPGKTEENPITFSIGKRACAGEGLVMAEAFTFIASLLQNFLFLPTTEEEKEMHFSYEETVQNKLRVFPRSATRNETPVS